MAFGVRLGAATLGLGMSLCVPVMAQPINGTAEPKAFEGQTMVYAGSGGNMQEAQTTAAWGPFAEITGLTVLQDASSFIKTKAMVESGDVVWDIALTDRIQTRQYCGTLFQKIDTKVVDLTHVAPDLISDDCMVPAMIYGCMIAYNGDTYPNGPQNWADFFDVEKFPGKRGIYMGADPDTSVVVAALLGDGVKPEDLYPIDFERAFKKLRSISKDIVPWTSGSQLQQQLESGEVQMAWVWSGRAMSAAANGHNIKPVWNDWIVEFNSLAIPVGAPNPQAAQAALNYYVGPEQTAKIAQLSGYGPVNVDAKLENLSDAAKVWMPTPERMKTGQYTNVEFWMSHWDELTEHWSAWVAGN